MGPLARLRLSPGRQSEMSPRPRRAQLPASPARAHGRSTPTPACAFGSHAPRSATPRPAGCSSVTLPLDAPSWLGSPISALSDSRMSGRSTPGRAGPVPPLALSRDGARSTPGVTTPESVRLDHSGRVTAEDFQRAMADAAPLLRSPATLGYAFLQLQAADALHQRLAGCSSAAALRKMAGCLAGAAAAELRRQLPETRWYDVSPGLPPAATGRTGRALAEARADLALGLLEAAVEAGWEPAADADLAVLAELRPVQFAALGRGRSKACRKGSHALP